MLSPRPASDSLFSSADAARTVDVLRVHDAPAGFTWLEVLTGLLPYRIVEETSSAYLDAGDAHIRVVHGARRDQDTIEIEHDADAYFLVEQIAEYLRSAGAHVEVVETESAVRPLPVDPRAVRRVS